MEDLEENHLQSKILILNSYLKTFDEMNQGIVKLYN